MNQKFPPISVRKERYHVDEPPWPQLCLLHHWIVGHSRRQTPRQATQPREAPRAGHACSVGSSSFTQLGKDIASMEVG